MSLLDNPHKTFRSIHIAGTNGKGSTAAIISSILCKAEYKTGLYTSPHLIDFSERIRVNEVMISEDRIVELTDRIKIEVEGYKRLNPSFSPTFFEFTTAIALLYFAEEEIDIGVIEVGMGGRLDATNVIDPMISVITNIDYDHTEYLGYTIEEIAEEKGGIIKEGISVVTGEDNKAAVKVIEGICQEKGAGLYKTGKDFTVERGRMGGNHLSEVTLFDYYGINMRERDLAISLSGNHQIYNAGVALAALEVLEVEGKIRIDKDVIRRGLKDVLWHGRLEIVCRNPLILLDGAHNRSGARMLASYLSELKDIVSGELILIYGVMKDKDISAIFQEILPIAERIVLTEADYYRRADIKYLEDMMNEYLAERRIAIKDIRKAIKYAVNYAREDDIICITGSLYLVGEARAFLAGDGIPSPVKG